MSIRMSTLVATMKASGEDDLVELIERLYVKIGDNCQEHGKLEDPILAVMTSPVGKAVEPGVATHGDMSEPGVVFACPWCSGSEVLAEWEREGKQNG